MRVGLIIYGSLDTISGGYLYDRQLMDYLRSCGDTVEVFSLPRRDYARHLLDNFSNGLYRQVRAAELDVLLEDELNHPSLLRFNRRLRGQVHYPIVSIVHHLRSCETQPPVLREWYRWIERRYLESVDGFICNSETTRHAIATVLNRTELARSVVAYPAGDRFGSTITPEVVEQRAHEAGPLRLVFVGNIIPRKGLLVLLEALLQLPPGTCQLMVVGDTSLDKWYMRVVYHLFMVTHLSGVTLMGVVSDADLAAILAHGHVLVVPSDYEGFGIAYLEGMGFGLPAIGTTSGAASEIIADGMNGYLIPPNDPAALAKRLMLLASDRDKLEQISLAARERFLAQPRWKDSMACVREALVNEAFQGAGQRMDNG